MHVSIDEFKGKKIFAIRKEEGDQFPYVSFGVGKAQVILEHLDEIKAFVDEHGDGAPKPKKGKKDG